MEAQNYIRQKIVYFAAYVVLDAGETGLSYKQVLTENEYREACEKYGDRLRKCRKFRNEQ